LPVADAGSLDVGSVDVDSCGCLYLPVVDAGFVNGRGKLYPMFENFDMENPFVKPLPVRHAVCQSLARVYTQALAVLSPVRYLDFDLWSFDCSQSSFGRTYFCCS
jgi:hypothetical protein